MKLNRKSARRMIGQIVGGLVFPHGRPKQEVATEIVARIASRASAMGREDVLPKHVNQIVNGSAELVLPAILNQVMYTVDPLMEVTEQVQEYHYIAVVNPRTSFVRRPVRRQHIARREPAHAMMRR